MIGSSISFVLLHGARGGDNTPEMFPFQDDNKQWALMSGYLVIVRYC